MKASGLRSILHQGDDGKTVKSLQQVTARSVGTDVSILIRGWLNINFALRFHNSAAKQNIQNAYKSKCVLYCTYERHKLIVKILSGSKTEFMIRD